MYITNIFLGNPVLKEHKFNQINNVIAPVTSYILDLICMSYLKIAINLFYVLIESLQKDMNMLIT